METKTFIKSGAAETRLFGEETYVQCCLGAFRGEIYFDYKYRHTNGRSLQPYAGRWYNAVPSVIFG